MGKLKDWTLIDYGVALNYAFYFGLVLLSMVEVNVALIRWLIL